MQKKILIAIILNVIVISATLGIISYFAVNESINRSLQDRLTLARIISNYVEVFLNRNLNRLYDVSLSGKINLEDDDWQPEKRMLETAYNYSLFTEGVFLLDKHGNELLTYPPHVEYFSNLTYINYVNQVLQYGKSVISNIYTIEPIKKKVIFIMVPLKDSEGMITGIVGGTLGPTEHFLNQLLQSGKIENNSYIEIIDSNEIVVASDNPSRIFQHHKHDSILSKMIIEGKAGILECRHGFSSPDSAKKPIDRLAFVPLSAAPWGVIVGQSEKEVFETSMKLKRWFLSFAIIFVASSTVFAVGLSRNIVKPIKSLIAATNRIAEGDLSKAVGNFGSDETLMLSRSFDDMRLRLAESRDSIQRHNLELEQRVAQRTKELEENRKKLADLLMEVMSAQEEERKRIARELHDDTSQSLNAMLMSLDALSMSLDGNDMLKHRLGQLREHSMLTLHGVHQMIKDLRPPVLDDLGLESAIRWCLERHLGEKGIQFYFKTTGKCKEIQTCSGAVLSCAKIELMLFRVIQEAIINVSKHANAENVLVSLAFHDSSLEITIEDDGEGFDIQKVFASFKTGKNRGFGLLGMKERIALVGGRLRICSRPQEGTMISACIPL
ncbi:MAG: HAMP domain-containing protein [Nitrospirae bacterium]|nr:HAMP domain-containing protein [Nitrospirota bacterium]